MAVYITRARLDVNGQEITDFKGVVEKSRTIRKSVPLMYKTGSADLTQRFTGELDYVVPRDTTPFKFDDITGGTLTITYDSGEETKYGGVAVLEVGDATIDGESELVRKISFMAETRNGLMGA